MYFMRSGVRAFQNREALDSLVERELTRMEKYQVLDYSSILMILARRWSFWILGIERKLVSILDLSHWSLYCKVAVILFPSNSH